MKSVISLSLAVAHEKGRLQFSSSQQCLNRPIHPKKLTLTCLSSALIAFTVLSLVFNPSNENFLAYYIIKPVWLPGSQTQLAVVTADSVKIYDLASGALNPAYYFLVPSGKIRDVTFVHTVSGDMFLLLMSSAGRIYFQQLCDDSSARHGSFYVTNIMDVSHVDVRDSGGSLAGGGVSIYYSHTLQMLFCNYAQVTEELSAIFPIQVRNPRNSLGEEKNTPMSFMFYIRFMMIFGSTIVHNTLCIHCRRKKNLIIF